MIPNVGREHPAVANDSWESSCNTEDPGGWECAHADALPGVEPNVPVSVVHAIADGGASVRGEWDRVVPKLTSLPGCRLW